MNAFLAGFFFKSFMSLTKSLYKSCPFFFFFNFCLRWVFAAARGLSPVALSGGHSSLQCTGFSLRWLLLLWSTGSRHVCFSSCGTRAQWPWLVGPRAQAQQLCHTNLLAPRHVGSSRTRDRTRVSCIGRWIPNYCATREVPILPIFDCNDFFVVAF